MKTKTKLSTISAAHYVKLVYRSALLIAALVVYIIGKVQHYEGGLLGFAHENWLLAVIGTVYAVEMILRLFPSKIDSMGCEKQFKCNYIPTGEEKPRLMSWKRTFVVASAWFALNGAIGALYFLGIIDTGVLILVSLAYGICDMICILFFCPFQTWFMKNRCCADCRIYNWDFPMMFTPYVFIAHKSVFTAVLLGLSLIILIRWEITLHVHPERFASNTNAFATCAHCKEKLCHHKKQLKGYWKKNKAHIWGK